MTNSKDKENLSAQFNNKTNDQYQVGKENISDDSLTDKAVPTIINGRYIVEKELGRGGVGVVYLAKDKQVMSKRVVIKVLLDEKITDEWVRVKFRQEMEALARIDHPVVISILDIGQMPDGKAYFVMPFVEGVTLRSLIKPEGMAIKSVANIIEQLGEALKAAHDKGVFHRDLKPENIMVEVKNKEERVKLIDFGVAKVKNPLDGKSTQVETVAGTFFYMSPEQLMGTPITAASDVFSLAVISYEMLTGRKPFFSETTNPSALLVQLVEQHQNGPALKPKSLRPIVSRDAEEIILQGLKCNVKKRYQNADEFGKELALALETQCPTPPLKIRDFKDLDSLADEVEANIKSPQNNIKLISSEWPKSKFIPRISTSSLIQNELINKRSMLAGSLVVTIILATLLLSKFPNRENLTNSITPTFPANTLALKSNLTYWIIVQRYRDGKAYKEPYRLSQEIAFQEGDCVKFFFVSPQQGYLYILNEGPSNKDGSLSNWNILFPTPFNNKGSSELGVNKPLEIAGGGEGFCFDKQEGTEKLWLVFSLEKIELLEDLKQWINEKDKGEIKDTSQMTTVRKFIQDSSITNTTLQKDDINKQTTISSPNKIIVVVLNLTHI